MFASAEDGDTWFFIEECTVQLQPEVCDALPIALKTFLK
jgi:hypothetical protein